MKKKTTKKESKIQFSKLIFPLIVIYSMNALAYDVVYCIQGVEFFLAVYFCSFLEKFGSETTLGTNLAYFLVCSGVRPQQDVTKYRI